MFSEGSQTQKNAYCAVPIYMKFKKRQKPKYGDENHNSDCPVIGGDWLEAAGELSRIWKYSVSWFGGCLYLSTFIEWYSKFYLKYKAQNGAECLKLNKLLVA